MITDLFILLYRGLRKIFRPVWAWLVTPRWVRHMPYDGDRESLVRVALAFRGRLSRPREFAVVLCNFSGKQSVENAIFTIEKEGWECESVAQEGAPGKTVLVCKKSDYQLTAENYHHDMAFFHRIASLYRADVDGWHAGGVARRQVQVSRLRWSLVVLAIALSFVIRGLFVYFAYENDTKVVREAAAQQAAQASASAQPSAASAEPAKSYAPKGWQAYNSKALGISFQYPANWLVLDNGSCQDSNAEAGTPDCKLQVSLKDWHERYVPTITLTSMSGDFSQLQYDEDKRFMTPPAADPNISWHKEMMQLGGLMAVKYVQVGYGETTTSIVSRTNQPKSLEVSGSTPRSQPKDLDYPEVFDQLQASVKMLR